MDREMKSTLGNDCLPYVGSFTLPGPRVTIGGGGFEGDSGIDTEELFGLSVSPSIAKY